MQPVKLEEVPRWKGLSAFACDNWLFLVALHPLIRVLILAPPSEVMPGLQTAEGFLWFSFWVVEALVIVTAIGAGFRIVPAFRGLPMPVQLMAWIWLAAVGIATLNATYFPPTIRSASTWVLHAIFALALWHLATRDRLQFGRAFDRFVLTLGWASAAAGMVSVAVIYSIGLSSDYPFGNDVPGFSNLRHSGYIFAPAIALCVGRLAFSPDRVGEVVLILVLNIALCLWFGSRGPFFGLICGLAVGVLLFREFRSSAFWKHFSVAAVTGAALSIAVPCPDHPYYNVLRRFLSVSTDASQLTSGRTELWYDAIRLIIERPLFGYGGEQFQYVSPVAANTYRHPHDFILQAIFDWGMIGGGAFLLMLGVGMIAASKVRRGICPIAKMAFFGALSMLGYAALDGILFYPPTIGITFILIATAIALSSGGDPATATGQRATAL
ncbi:MAG TPA: O-antigen ligase family protein [Croceibacterium sp.]|nr:O-antigen ligase family protein [Croceibacterium sp.]